MIEVTKEMVELVYEQIDFVNHGDDGIAEGLAAVLALVERDYFVGERIPARCLAKSGTFHCALVHGHGDLHTASLGAGLGWSWS